MWFILHLLYSEFIWEWHIKILAAAALNNRKLDIMLYESVF